MFIATSVLLFNKCLAFLRKNFRLIKTVAPIKSTIKTTTPITIPITSSGTRQINIDIILVKAPIKLVNQEKLQKGIINYKTKKSRLLKF